MRQLVQVGEVPERVLALFAALIVPGLVGQRPHDHARMVLVAPDHVANHVLMMPEQLLIVVLGPVHADGRGLVDDDDALAVAQIVHVLRVRVVRGAEGVRAKPVDQRHVLDVQQLVGAAAVEITVLVLAESLEVEGLAVDEELGALDFDRADAEALVVFVGVGGAGGAERHVRGVEVGRAGVPQVRRGDVDVAGGAGGGGHGVAELVLDGHRDVVRFGAAAEIHLVADGRRAGFAFFQTLGDGFGHDGDVCDVVFRRGVELHVTVETREVEEVEVRPVLRLGPALARLDGGDAGIVGAEERHAAFVAHRQGGLVDAVVDRDGQTVLAGLDLAGDVEFERQEASLVAAQLVAVEVHVGLVGGGVEAQYHALARDGARGDFKGALVHDPAVLAAQVEQIVLVVVGAGNGHGDGVADRRVHPFGWISGFVGGLEIPDAIQAEHCTGVVHLRVQHVYFLPSRQLCPRHFHNTRIFDQLRTFSIKKSQCFCQSRNRMLRGQEWPSTGGSYSTDLSELTGSMRSSTGLVISCTTRAKAIVAEAAMR